MEIGDLDRFDRSVEDDEGPGSAVARRDPVVVKARLRPFGEQSVGALGDIDAGELCPCPVDERAVQGDRGGEARIEVEQGDEMLRELLAAFAVARSGIEIFRKVALHPGDEEAPVGGDEAAQHEIGFERSEEEARVARLGLELLLEPQEQPRPQEPLETMVIGGPRRRAQPRVLAEPESFEAPRWRRRVGRAAGQGAQGKERGQDLAQVGVGHNARACDRSGDLGIVGGGFLAAVDLRARPGIARPPSADHERCDDEEAREAREASQAAAAARRDPSGLADHHLLDEVGQEEALALAGEGRGPHRLRAEALGERAEQLVDRRAELGPRGEVEAAQGRAGAFLGRREDLVEERCELHPQGGDLGREAEQEYPAGRVPLLGEPLREAAGQPLDQGVELGGNLAEHRPRLVHRLERGAEDLRAAGLVEPAEIFHEAADEIGLGEERIDRKVDIEPCVQLGEASPDRSGMGGDLRLGQGEQVLEADRHEHAVDRLARPVAVKQIEEGEPAPLVEPRVGILRRIAAGRIDQDGVLGEPPIAIAGSADALELVRNHAFGEGKFEARVDERGRLARAGRADQEIPRQVVEVAGLAAAQAAQPGEGLLHALGEDGLVAFVGTHAGGNSIRPEAAAPNAQRDNAAGKAEDAGDDRDPGAGILERAAVREGHERPGEPDQRRDGHDTGETDQDPEPRSFLHRPDLREPSGIFQRAGDRLVSRKCGKTNMWSWFPIETDRKALDSIFQRAGDRLVSGPCASSNAWNSFLVPSTP
jgi:hypothetical protein